MRSMSFTALGLMFLVACGGEEAPTAAPAAAVSAPTPAPDPTPLPAPASVVAPSAVAPATAPAAGEALTVAALREGFAANQSEWIGREITLRGLFLSATVVGGAVNNVQILGARDEDMMTSITCGFGADAPASVSATQWTEITVRGAVRERFGRPALERCAITAQ